MDTKLMVTGMFRSGTSLMTRLLDVHPQLSVAADLYQQIFKEFRNTLQSSLDPGRAVDPDAPLEDYYFDRRALKLFSSMQATGLDVPVGDLSFKVLLKKLRDYSRDFSPRILDHLELISGGTYAALLEQGFEVVRKAYGTESTQVTGFKVTWATEFVPHLLSVFPEAKALVVIRDPRAVCASRNVNPAGKYPLLFMGRQWRKLASLAWLYSTGAAGDRVLVVRYEDLIENPEPVCRNICGFLDVGFDQRMIHPESYVDGAGKPWLQNTSYNHASKGFNKSSLEKWKEVLTAEEILLIEGLCYPEMLLHGYVPSLSDAYGFEPRTVADPPEVLQKDLVDWIKPYACVSREGLLREMALEHWRCGLLKGDLYTPDAVQRLISLDPAIFFRTRSLIAEKSGRPDLVGSEEVTAKAG